MLTTSPTKYLMDSKFENKSLACPDSQEHLYLVREKFYRYGNYNGREARKALRTWEVDLEVAIL